MPCVSVLTVAALDGRPLGNGQVQAITEEITLSTGALHIAKIHLFAIQTPDNPIILGLPWLQKHETKISWSSTQVTVVRCMFQNLHQPVKTTHNPGSIGLFNPFRHSHYPS